MTIPDYVDEYLKLKDPESYSRFRDLYDSTVTDFLKSRGIHTEEQREAFKKTTTQYWADRRQNEIEKADKRILEIWGFTVHDLDALEAERTQKKKGGRMPNHAAQSRETAFESFLDSEREGHNFAEAINAAKDRCNDNPTEKSLRNWLKNLIKYGVCKIPLPTRKKLRN